MRTCATCDFKVKDGCVHRHLVDYVDDTSPACEKWSLSDRALFKLINDSMSKSRKVKFMPRPSEANAYKYEMAAILNRHLCESVEGKLDPLIYALLSNVYAFVGDVAHGNFDASMEHAGDAIAILIRSLNREWEKEYSHDA